MSKELEIKFHSGATISFIGEDSGESLKGFDNTKILQALGEYNNTDHGKDFEEFDLFEKQPKMKKQYSSKQRKLHKLKRENVVLGQKRKLLENSLHIEYEVWKNTHVAREKYNRRFEGILNSCEKIIFNDLNNLNKVSEQIGKNSAKIQRLRTQIQQEKMLNEYSNCT